jgi:glycosyltransferase involved in cell wall biosynthesis
MNPLVSVAIITYNQKEYLRDCIESVLIQDYSNIEIVIADDASTDGTQQMLVEYEKKNPGKFILHLSNKNQGITANSNLAHFACSGKYIAWMGGDDLMLPGKLSKQVDFMEKNPNCSICYHNLDVFDSKSNKTLYYFNKNNIHEGDIRKSIRFGTFNGACSTMVRTEKAPKDGFNKTLPVASDWLYWIETLANGGEINYLDDVLGRYRRHENNVTADNNCTTIKQNKIDHLNTCNIILSKYPQHLSDIKYAFSNRILALRHKAPYLSILLMSIRVKTHIKALGALVVYLMTLGNIRL